jgi:uncharacterized membrane protein
MRTVKGLRFMHLTYLPAIGAFAGLAVGVAAILATGPAGKLAASAKADFSLAATPASQSAQQGQVASYTVSEAKLNGFKDAVSLTASNLPAGASATFSPQTLDSKTSSSFAVTIGASTPAATYNNITITGTGGGITHTAVVSLTVTPVPTPSFSIAATPASATMLPGDTAAYTVSTSPSNGFTGAISFSVAGAPTGSTSTFTPTSVSVGGSSSLQVATKNNAAGGNYTLTITGTSGTKTQTTTVTLVLATTGKQFSITVPSVVIAGPGASQSLNLSMTNTNSQTLQITNLTVSVQSVTKAAGAPAGACTAADYAITQYSGAYPLAIPAGQTRSLSSLVSSSAWPKLSMVNTSSNQDGCKLATIQLSVSGAGQG